MKAFIKFFKKDKVQITFMSIGAVVFICGFIIAFVFKAFPEDPIKEEKIRQAEIRDAEHAKWYKELKEKNGWDE